MDVNICMDGTNTKRLNTLCMYRQWLVSIHTCRKVLYMAAMIWRELSGSWQLFYSCGRQTDICNPLRCFQYISLLVYFIRFLSKVRHRPVKHRLHHLILIRLLLQLFFFLRIGQKSAFYDDRRPF